MNKVYACIDGLAHTNAVVDWAAWSAQRLQLPLEFLHVLERHPEHAESRDFSGAIGIDAQESLLQSLSDADQVLGKQAQEAGRRLLSYARERATAAGVTALDARLRHGEFVETVQEMEPDARLIVLGEHTQARGKSRLQVDHHVEQVIRAVHRPVLVATTGAFVRPERIVMAFDGSSRARQILDTVNANPLLAGLPVRLVTVGADTPAARQRLTDAQAALAAGGIDVAADLLAGDPQTVLPDVVKAQAPALLVMGAFGHSRLRQFFFGSTTRMLLRVSAVPLLVRR